MVCVQRGHEVADVDRIEGPPENAESEGPAHARSVATGRPHPRRRHTFAEPRREIGCSLPRTLVR
jgi:hypothetical protein